MRVLLVGAGYVASALAPLLVTLGHEVFGLRRSERSLPPSVRPLRGDITKPDSLSDIPEKVDVVVFAVSPGERSRDAYHSVFSRGLDNVLAMTPGARVLFVSSTSVYGPSTALVDETTPADSPAETTAPLVEGERRALAHHPASVVLRASGIYGPGRTRTIETLLASPPTGDSRNEITHRVHRDDLARALAFFAERPSTSGLYVVTDDRPSTLGELSDFLEGVALPPSLERVRRERPPRERSRSPSLRSHKRLTNQKLREAGFSFEYPSFEEGYAAIFAEMRARES